MSQNNSKTPKYNSEEKDNLLEQFKGWLLARVSRSTRNFTLAYTRRFLNNYASISKEALEDFIQKLDVSEKSKANIRSAIMQFLRFLRELGYYVPHDLLPKVEESEEKLLREFEEWLELEGLAKRTIYIYKLHANYWINWCRSRGIDILFSSEDDARAFLLDVKRRPGRGVREGGLKARAIGAWINDLRKFYDFLNWKFKVGDNPFRGLKGPKREKKLPTALSIQDVERIFKAAEELSLEHYALVRFIYASGTRIGECAKLLWKDLDFRLNQAIIRGGKGNKDRIVFFDDETAQILKRLRAKKRGSRGDFVFGPSVRTLFRMIEEISKKVGIRFRSNDLRKSLATHMAELGVPVQNIQYIMGHERLDTTGIYIQLRPEHVRSVYRRFWDLRRNRKLDEKVI
ncbi:MAG: tyrosine-type recombinase/integrase [Thermoproteota archaeon]